MPLPLLILAAAHPVDPVARELHRCSGKLTVTGEGLGALRIGESEAALRKVCHVPKRKLKRGEEPPPEGVLQFKIGPTPVQAELADERLWRVIVDGPGPKTADKLGVGSTLGALLASGEARAAQSEGVLYVSTARHCGVSFQLGFKPARGEDRDSWSHEALSRLPQDLKVERVLISGCQAAR